MSNSEIDEQAIWQVLKPLLWKREVWSTGATGFWPPFEDGKLQGGLISIQNGCITISVSKMTARMGAALVAIAALCPQELPTPEGQMLTVCRQCKAKVVLAGPITWADDHWVVSGSCQMCKVLLVRRFERTDDGSTFSDRDSPEIHLPEPDESIKVELTTEEPTGAWVDEPAVMTEPEYSEVVLKMREQFAKRRRGEQPEAVTDNAGSE